MGLTAPVVQDEEVKAQAAAATTAFEEENAAGGSAGERHHDVKAAGSPDSGSNACTTLLCRCYLHKHPSHCKHHHNNRLIPRPLGLLPVVVPIPRRATEEETLAPLDLQSAITLDEDDQMYALDVDNCGDQSSESSKRNKSHESDDDKDSRRTETVDDKPPLLQLPLPHHEDTNCGVTNAFDDYDDCSFHFSDSCRPQHPGPGPNPPLQREYSKSDDCDSAGDQTPLCKFNDESERQLHYSGFPRDDLLVDDSTTHGSSDGGGDDDSMDDTDANSLSSCLFLVSRGDNNNYNNNDNNHNNNCANDNNNSNEVNVNFSVTKPQFILYSTTKDFGSLGKSAHATSELTECSISPISASLSSSVSLTPERRLSEPVAGISEAAAAEAAAAWEDNDAEVVQEDPASAHSSQISLPPSESTVAESLIVAPLSQIDSRAMDIQVCGQSQPYLDLPPTPMQPQNQNHIGDQYQPQTLDVRFEDIVLPFATAHDPPQLQYAVTVAARLHSLYSLALSEISDREATIAQLRANIAQITPEPGNDDRHPAPRSDTEAAAQLRLLARISSLRVSMTILRGIVNLEASAREANAHANRNTTCNNDLVSLKNDMNALSAAFESEANSLRESLRVAEARYTELQKTSTESAASAAKWRTRAERAREQLRNSEALVCSLMFQKHYLTLKMANPNHRVKLTTLQRFRAAVYTIISARILRKPIASGVASIQQKFKTDLDDLLLPY